MNWLPTWLRKNLQGSCRGFGIQIQHIFHMRDEVGADGGQTPFFPLPRLQVVFLSARRMVSSEMQPTTRISTRRSANNWSVQRCLPAGGALQAVAITYASSLVPSFRGAEFPSAAWAGIFVQGVVQIPFHEAFADALHRGTSNMQGRGNVFILPSLIGMQQDMCAPQHAGSGRSTTEQIGERLTLVGCQGNMIQFAHRAGSPSSNGLPSRMLLAISLMSFVAVH
jgi:hypothetical protein